MYVADKITWCRRYGDTCSIITGKIKLEIYDELGNLIYMKSLNKDDIELSIPVSLIDIGDGIFYYRIKNGNNIINNGIFSIIR